MDKSIKLHLEMVDMIERQINVARNTIVLNYG
jgi:hypothetical protein